MDFIQVKVEYSNFILFYKNYYLFKIIFFYVLFKISESFFISKEA